MTYEYEALENTPGAIRTFVLYPAEQLDDPILGELQHVSHKCYKYTAVSYVWGNPSHVHSIQISGRPFGVANNLFNVLRSLRDQAEPISLWIDAICIDQNNVLERNAQVQKMASIYRNMVGKRAAHASERPTLLTFCACLSAHYSHVKR